MSVLAMVVVTQWAEAELAATPVAGRPWVDHLVDRLRRAPGVSGVAVVCQPACRDRVAPHVPPGVTCVTATDPFAWAAAGAAPLVAWVPVWQLFVDPGRLARLAAAARPAGTTVVRAVLEHAPSVDLTGGADAEVFTATGLRMAAGGLDIGPGVLAVPLPPAPPELRLRGPGDAGWGVTLQGALVAAGRADDLSAVEAVMTAAGLHRLDVWLDGAGLAPRRMLTVRCLPAAEFAWLLRHLARLPGAAIDVVCPAAHAAATAAMPGVRRVVPFAGPAFALTALDPVTRARLRAEQYDLCVVPRRTPCGHGFENVTAIAADAGAGLAVWMDLTGRTGVLAGNPRGWEPWVTAPAPWLRGEAWRARGAAALARSTGAAAHDAGDGAIERRAAQVLDVITARMDEVMACHALTDAAGHGLDLAPVFLHQQPGVAAARDQVARARAAGRRCASALASAVDAACRRGVDALAEAPAGPAARAAGAAVTAFAGALQHATESVLTAADGSAAEARALAALDGLRVPATTGGGRA